MKNEYDFEEKFREVGEYFNIDSPMDVREFLRDNPAIFLLLDEAKPYIERIFSDDRYCLEMVYDPECVACNHLVLKIYVPLERYQNGVRDDIEEVRYNLRPLRRKLKVFTKFAVRADIENV